MEKHPTQMLGCHTVLYSELLKNNFFAASGGLDFEACVYCSGNVSALLTHCEACWVATGTQVGFRCSAVTCCGCVYITFAARQRAPLRSMSCPPSLAPYMPDRNKAVNLWSLCPASLLSLSSSLAPSGSYWEELTTLPAIPCFLP